MIIEAIIYPPIICVAVIKPPTNNICNIAAGQTTGLIWEHFDVNWKADVNFSNDNEALKIFRPWGFRHDPYILIPRMLICYGSSAKPVSNHLICCFLF